MSYLLLHRWYVATITLLLVAWVLVEIRERVKRPKRAMHDVRRTYVDEAPWKDPRDSQRVDQEHRKLYPSRFT